MLLRCPNLGEKKNLIFVFTQKLAEMPSVARGIKKKIKEKEKNVAYVTYRAPMGYLKKFQPIQSSRLASYS